MLTASNFPESLVSTPYSIRRVTGVYACHVWLVFHVGAEDLNLGPHAYALAALTN